MKYADPSAWTKGCLARWTRDDLAERANDDGQSDEARPTEPDPNVAKSSVEKTSE